MTACDAPIPRVRFTVTPAAPADVVTPSAALSAVRARSAAHADAVQPVVWWRTSTATMPGSEPSGLVGIGSVAEFTFTGARGLTAAGAWFDAVSARAISERAVSSVASAPHGLIGVFSAPFAPDSDGGVLRIPRTTLVWRAEGAWLIEAERVDGGEPAPDTGEQTSVDSDRPGPMAPFDRATWQTTVESAVQAIAADAQVADGLRKVVLARSEHADFDHPVDPIALVDALAASYPECWVYLCDGLVGASPELLVRRQGADLTSRALAGTAVPSDPAHTPAAGPDSLLSSPKDLHEHAFAAQSVVANLARWSGSPVEASDPFVLALPNVAHLATDIRARVPAAAQRPGALLEVAAALHPTAAVGGVPSERALELITALEGSRRGRYAGPIGWLDATGDGEAAIALRCAMLDGDLRGATLWAGCGIVTGSQAAAEWRETEAKMAPMRAALRANCPCVPPA